MLLTKRRSDEIILLSIILARSFYFRLFYDHFTFNYFAIVLFSIIFSLPLWVILVTLTGARRSESEDLDSESNGSELGIKVSGAYGRRLFLDRAEIKWIGSQDDLSLEARGYDGEG